MARGGGRVSFLGGGGLGRSGHITISGFSYESIGQGTWIFGPDTAQFQAGNIFNSSNADGDNLSYKVDLPAGTYTLRLHTKTQASAAILDFDIDGVEVASFDLYSAVTTRNVLKTQTGIVIATGGIKTLKARVDGRHGGVTYWYALINSIVLWRTA